MASRDNGLDAKEKLLVVLPQPPSQGMKRGPSRNNFDSAPGILARTMQQLGIETTLLPPGDADPRHVCRVLADAARHAHPVFLTFNTYAASLHAVRRAPCATFAFWLIDDIRYLGAEFFSLLRERNVIMFVADRQIYRDLMNVAEESVYYLPWAAFASRPSYSMPYGPAECDDVVFVGNIGRYLSLPGLAGCQLNSAEQQYLGELANRLVFDLRYDVRSEVMSHLSGYGLSTRQKTELAARIEFVVRCESNRHHRRKVIEVLALNGVRLSVFGDPAWRGRLRGVAKYRGPISGQNCAQVVSRAKITLSLDSLTMPDSVHLRVFDSLMCGGFVISQYVPSLSAMFGDSVPTFAELHELPRLVHKFLDDGALRRCLAADAREKCVNAHRVEHRCRMIVAAVANHLARKTN